MARAVVGPHSAMPGTEATPPRWDLEGMRAAGHVVSGVDFYTKIWANQGGTGSSFRWIDRIWHGHREALCHAVCPPAVTDAGVYVLHPGLIEAACQVLHGSAEIETVASIEEGLTTYVPFSIDTFTVYRAAGDHRGVWCHARLRELVSDHVVADLTLLDAEGEELATVKGFTLRPITRAMVVAHLNPSNQMREPRDETGLSMLPVRHDPAPLLQGEAVVAYLRRKCADLSGYAEAEFADDRGLIEQGIDSLSALRLANALARDLGRSVPARDILLCDSLRQLADAVCAAGATTGGRDKHQADG
jgi:acyl carrier protein